MSRGQVHTGAVVQLTLEIQLGDSWGADCKLDQVIKQASDGARDAVRKLCEASSGRIRVVEVKEVKAVTWVEP